jgi:hypothetical protein
LFQIGASSVPTRRPDVSVDYVFQKETAGEDVQSDADATLDDKSTARASIPKWGTS